MNFLNNVHSLINHSHKQIVANTHYAKNTKQSNIIDGKFKVLPDLNKEIKDLDNLCKECTKNCHAHTKQFHKDKALWNEARTGYTNPYTSPIQH